jgi:NTE family protein
MMGRPRVGLALGGGGARGYAHLGVIRTLRAHQVPIDVIAGTSMGAVIGGAYACGVDLNKLERIIKTLDLNRMLRFPRSSLRGLVGNTASEYLFQRRDWRSQDLEGTRAIVEFLNVFTQRKSFSDLEICFAVVTVDIDTGEEIVVREGPVSRAVTAGITIPGIHYPIEHQGRYLIDGGLINRVPADVAFSLGADVVIAVNVSSGLTSGPVTSVEVLMQAESIVLREMTRLRLEVLRQRVGDRLFLLEPPVEHIKTLSLDKVDPPIHAGEEETSRRMGEIQALIARYTS